MKEKESTGAKQKFKSTRPRGWWKWIDTKRQVWKISETFEYFIFIYSHQYSLFSIADKIRKYKKVEYRVKKNEEDERKKEKKTKKKQRQLWKSCSTTWYRSETTATLWWVVWQQWLVLLRFLFLFLYIIVNNNNNITLRICCVKKYYKYNIFCFLFDKNIILFIN